MARLAEPRAGESIGEPYYGFPAFYSGSPRQRVITGDIWSYLKHVSNESSLSEAAKERCSAFVDQAFDFFHAAANPRQASRPLLYYYAFLNLAKLVVLHSGVRLPLKLKHGIEDIEANYNAERLRLEGQRVHVPGRSPTAHKEFFPELVHATSDGHPVRLPRKFHAITLLSQIPAVHRTFSMVNGSQESFCPILAVSLRKRTSATWAHMRLEKHKLPSEFSVFARSRGFKSAFRQVRVVVPAGQEQSAKRYVDYELREPVPYHGRGLHNAILELARRFRRVGIWAIFSSGALHGCRYYLNTSVRQTFLPQICSAYAAMFYFGSVTRYRPQHFEKLVGKHAWVINELLDTQPTQFLHSVASFIAGTEVVAPGAVRLGVV